MAIDPKRNHAIDGVALTRGQRADLVTRTVVGGPSGTKAVLMVLDQYGGQNPDSWPSMETICRSAEIGRRQVTRCITYLVKQGLLWFEDQQWGRHSRVYWIQYPALYQLRCQQIAETPPARRPGRPRKTPAHQAGVFPNNPGLAGQGGQSGAGIRENPGLPGASPGQGGAYKQASNVSLSESSNKPRPAIGAMQGSERHSRAWQIAMLQVVRRDIPNLGVREDGTIDNDSITALLTRAGSEQRVKSILAMIKRRSNGIKNQAAYFASACTNPNWS